MLYWYNNIIISFQSFNPSFWNQINFEIFIIGVLFKRQHGDTWRDKVYSQWDIGRNTVIKYINISANKHINLHAKLE